MIASRLPLSNYYPLNLLIFLLLIRSATGILNGDVVEWTRNGWLVKVLARNDEGTVQACSGSLISSTLVISAAECVVNRATRTPLTEFAVITSASTSLKRITYSASLLETSSNKSWALLRISPQNISEICPPEPAPKRIARLNINPTLLGPSRFKVAPSSRCQIVGFETTINATEFIDQNRTMRIDLNRLIGPEQQGSHHSSSVMRNMTACFDDTGLPLLCYSIHYGFLQSLSFLTDSDDPGESFTSVEMCQKATEMEYTMITEDASLLKALQKHDMEEIISTYRACGFINPEDN